MSDEPDKRIRRRPRHSRATPYEHLMTTFDSKRPSLNIKNEPPSLSHLPPAHAVGFLRPNIEGLTQPTVPNNHYPIIATSPITCSHSPQSSGTGSMSQSQSPPSPFIAHDTNTIRDIDSSSPESPSSPPEPIKMGLEALRTFRFDRVLNQGWYPLCVLLWANSIHITPDSVNRSITLLGTIRSSQTSGPLVPTIVSLQKTPFDQDHLSGLLQELERIQTIEGNDIVCIQSLSRY